MAGRAEDQEMASSPRPSTPRSPPADQSEFLSAEEVVARRSGDVLLRHTILKGDHFPGCQNMRLRPLVEGAPNFRQVEGTPVYGVAIPTVAGLRRVLDLLGAAKGRRRVLWHSMREEPVIYINGAPFVVREADKPFANLEYTGIDRERVEAMEARLKLDVLHEAALYGNQILVAEEDDSFQVVQAWQPVSEADVQTPAEVYHELVEDGYDIDYLRVPVTDEKAPKSRDFDTLTRRCWNPPRGAALVFNCQMGRGRTTTGMVIGTLLTLRAELAREAGRGGELKRGYWGAVRSLLRVLDGGLASKRVLDCVLDACSAMQNLRTATLSYRNRVATERNDAQRGALLSVTLEYLERYYTLIVFAAYVGAPGFDPGADGRAGFARWTAARDELSSILERLLRMNPLAALELGRGERAPAPRLSPGAPNLRELRGEPVVYVNGEPFVLREASRPFKNLMEYRGIAHARLESMEERLAADVATEAAAHGGRLLVTRELEAEDGAGGRRTLREGFVSVAEVATPRQLGGGRTTMGMAVGALLREYLNGFAVGVDWQGLNAENLDEDVGPGGALPWERGLDDAGGGGAYYRLAYDAANNAEQLEVGSHGAPALVPRSAPSAGPVPASLPEGTVWDQEAANLWAGEYVAVRRLCRVLERGDAAKAAVDAVADAAGTLINLRTTIMRYRRPKSLDKFYRPEIQARHAAFARGSAYLERYLMLIAFAAYLGECRERGRRASFARWWDARPDIRAARDFVHANPASALAPVPGVLPATPAPAARARRAGAALLTKWPARGSLEALVRPGP
ncbi:hypothetical protein QBZ16_003536 [Prototheca wickerhamii]|uniref:Uncharacterized protein n=1 Tax=Prototheca wickerhamii TaxID=3111 RepID=A0AAD9IHQ1_PROWI|nr:hypothetical protein QBZ16_003536 [Prototheca wickerhamii]